MNPLPIIRRYTVWSVRDGAAGPYDLQYLCGHLHRTESGAQQCANRMIQEEAQQGIQCRAYVRSFALPSTSKINMPSGGGDAA